MTAKPIVILASGQSNIANHPSYSWTPPSNLLIWDFDGSVDPATKIGAAFQAPSGTTLGVAAAFAAKLASEDPARQVYLINIGIGGLLIAQWLAGASSPDMYACLKNNTQAALASVGISSVDYLLWWQGEADAVSDTQTYQQKFQSLHDRLRGEAWFPVATPVLLMGLSPFYGDTRVRFFNEILRETVANDPNTRIWVPTNSLPQSLWEAPLLIHMTGMGYKAAGELAATALRTGATTTAVVDWRSVVRPVSETRNSSAALTSDKYLRFPVKAGKSYKIEGSIFVIGLGCGFNFALVGPENVTVLTQISNTQTSPSPSLVRGYPAGLIPAGVAFNAVISFESIVIICSTDGEIAFQWGQQVADPNNCGVYLGSELRYIELA